MNGAEVGVAALKEIGAPEGRVEGPMAASFAWDEIRHFSPVVFWRAHCIARLSVNRDTETFDEWRERLKAAPYHRRLLNHQAFCDWLDNVEAPNT